MGGESTCYVLADIVNILVVAAVTLVHDKDLVRVRGVLRDEHSGFGVVVHNWSCNARQHRATLLDALCISKKWHIPTDQPAAR